jgi:hypothetical protein
MRRVLVALVLAGCATSYDPKWTKVRYSCSLQ